MVASLVHCAEALAPHATKAVAYAQWARRQGVWDELLPLFAGVVLVFFGGMYQHLIAACEAFHATGYAGVKKAVSALYANVVKAKEASDKDDLVDANGDGVSDVQQMEPKELARHKLGVALKAVDPAQLAEAASALCGGLMAVLAVLKLRFAASITLGNSLGDIAARSALPLALPAVAAALPPEYKRWAEPMFQCACKAAGVVVALGLQRVMAALHSAFRGAEMLLACALLMARRRGYHPQPAALQSSASTAAAGRDEEPDPTSPAFLGGVIFLAVTGFCYQLRSRFSHTFPLNLVMLPFGCAESLLSLLVYFA